jgi:hypothetical protein
MLLKYVVVCRETGQHLPQQTGDEQSAEGQAEPAPAQKVSGRSWHEGMRGTSGMHRHSEEHRACHEPVTA